MAIKKVEKIVLSKEEEQTIETQRKQVEKLEKFKIGYQKLVDETGFAWMVDINSPLNNIQLGIGRVNK